MRPGHHALRSVSWGVQDNEDFPNYAPFWVRRHTEAPYQLATVHFYRVYRTCYQQYHLAMQSLSVAQSCVTQRCSLRDSIHIASLQGMVLCNNLRCSVVYMSIGGLSPIDSTAPKEKRMTIMSIHPPDPAAPPAAWVEHRPQSVCHSAQ